MELVARERMQLVAMVTLAAGPKFEKLIFFKIRQIYIKLRKMITAKKQ